MQVCVRSRSPRRLRPTRTHDLETRRQPDVIHYYRPPNRTRCQRVKEFLWNKKERTCCSRTPLNWTMITIYYIIFLTVVFTTLFGCLIVVEWVATTRNPNEPRYSFDESPIGTNPGVNFLPLDINFGPLVRVDESSNVKQIESFLSKYKGCNDSGCFDVSTLAECGSPPYGYDTDEPCIYVKLNRLIGWVPDPYTLNDTLPGNLPPELNEVIKNSTRAKVWVHCRGSAPVDRDHIRGTLSYKNQGFDLSGFPYRKQKKFLDPLVVIKINTTDLKRTVYTVSCSAYAKNLDVDQAKSEFLLYTQ